MDHNNKPLQEFWHIKRTEHDLIVYKNGIKQPSPSFFVGFSTAKQVADFKEAMKKYFDSL